MKRKAVFFDIDGTLYDPVVGIPDSAKEGIRKLRENGHMAFLCTGRTPVMIWPMIKEIGFDGMIAGCGTYIEYEGRVLDYYYGQGAKMYQTARRLTDKGYLVFGEGCRNMYYDEQCTHKQKEIIHGKFSEMLGERFIPLTDENVEISKIYINLADEPFDYELFADLESDFDLICHGKATIEMVPKHYDKAQGIKRLIEYLGIDRRDTYAFGDSMNDMQMLDYVEYGIAMGNSTPEILKRAEYVTKSLKEDGIFEGLKQFNLI